MAEVSRRLDCGDSDVEDSSIEWKADAATKHTHAQKFTCQQQSRCCRSVGLAAIPFPLNFGLSERSEYLHLVENFDQQCKVWG